jgi:hypothetical protein
MKKLPKYKQEGLLRRELISKAWWLLKGEIISKDEYKILIDKIVERWKETKTLEVFPDYYQ